MAKQKAVECAAEEIVKWFFECDGTQPQKQKEVVAILEKHKAAIAREIRDKALGDMKY